jgi:hypothetical protein
LSYVLFLAPVLLFAFTLAFILRMAIKLLWGGEARAATPEWFATFSMANYDPMEALLREEDFEFLSRQPGFDLALYKKLRRERLRIFRQYMNRLIADYHRLHAVARVLLADSSYDRSDTLLRLVLLRANFAAAVFRAEGNYLLCCLGFRTLEVRALLVRLQQLNAQVAAMSAFRAA